MKHLILLCATLIFSYTAMAQLSVKSPSICHDQNQYLSCYNDGEYILRFSEGSFSAFETTDRAIRYSDGLKQLSFFMQDFVDAAGSDTVHIKLRAKSLLLCKGNDSLQLSSLVLKDADLIKYGVGYIRNNNIVSGLFINSAKRQIEIKMTSTGKTWNWGILIRRANQLFSIHYNNSDDDGLQFISRMDYDSKYGMSIGTTMKSPAKISSLRSQHMDTVGFRPDGVPVMGFVQPEGGFRYEYRKTGKLYPEYLKFTKTCDCK